MLGKCFEDQLVEVNSFDRSTEKWKNENFKIDKASNFHGCKFNFVIVNSPPEVTHAVIDKENIFIKACDGYVCALLRDFSSA